jgi:hypothetical protein
METLQTIARKFLGFTTLETRRSDSLDFKEVSVESVKKALEAAYQLGRSHANSPETSVLIVDPYEIHCFI